MPALARFASVRQGVHPAMRSAPFRDDSLIALRYDNTVASEPPIHIPPPPPRNPLRKASRPIIITPPISPPTEEHPALRGTGASITATTASKRDSGLPPTSPTSTLREEGDDYVISCKVDQVIELYEDARPEHMDDDDDMVSDDEGALSRYESLVSSTTTTTTTRSNKTGGTTPAREYAALQTTATFASSPPRSVSSASTVASLDVASPSPSTSSSSRKFIIRKSFSSRSLLASAREWCSDPPADVSVDASVDAKRPAPLRIMSPLASLPRSTRTSPEAQAQTSSPSSRRWPPPPPLNLLKRSSPPNSPTPTITSDQLTDVDYEPLNTPIPSNAFLEDDFITRLSFSNRGSILLGGNRALGLDGAIDSSPTTMTRDIDNAVPTIVASESAPSSTISVSNAQAPSQGHTLADMTSTTTRETLAPPTITTPLDAELERESEKVRSFYATGEELRWEDGAPPSSSYGRLEPTLQTPREEEEHDPFITRTIPAPATPRSGSVCSQPREERKPTDLAGGFEDWEDVDPALVDRYGFIVEPPRIHSRPSSQMGTPPSLKSVQFSPRRRLQKRDPQAENSLGTAHLPRRQYSRRSLNTQHSNMSVTSIKSTRSVVRQATNFLPYNRDRRWMDEAGDMLTTSLQDLAEEAKAEKISDALKKKEYERSEKWRKMAKNVKKGEQGEGMEFEFDVKNPKLIERTWKGIPDRWRGAAWWSFMAENAKNDDRSPTDDSIISDFHRLQQRGSPDDVQIDLDVPRTISRHIMFRRRYRGGQRLMFRVLHALSLYFPETGYVQGMASLAATLLCYFDEEKCFVMLVRMWQLRGLEHLYRPGFEGLMAALKDFDTTWLNKDVATKLNDMGIDNTAYGTRWYLTLFNLSIPFAAQLRVWDVFLLLGGTSQGHTSSAKSDPSAPPPSMDMLHATSAALIQALREVLLDSDFENAMKALTSWIPIKDEDMLMKVTKAEWKTHQSRRKA